MGPDTVNVNELVCTHSEPPGGGRLNEGVMIPHIHLSTVFLSYKCAITVLCWLGPVEGYCQYPPPG